MNNGNICVSLFAATASGLIEQVRQAEPLADVIELRCDHLPPGEIDELFEKLPPIKKKYLFTFRPKEQGGARDLSLSERTAFWKAIRRRLMSDVDMIDVEPDLEPPDGFDPERTIASLHRFEKKGFDPSAAVENLKSSGAEILKVAFMADDITDTIAVMRLMDMASAAGKSMIPIAMGNPGKWTRVLGLSRGAYMTYGSLGDGGETAAGQIPVTDLVNVYRVKELDQYTDVYGIIAGDTSYSMSPFIHNAAFAACKMNAVFVPLQVGDLARFVRRMVRAGSREIDLNFKGFSVTNPHKRAIIEHLGHIDPGAAAIGAVNTVKIEGNELQGFNTDAEGFIKPLLKVFGGLDGSRTAIVGTGGAARACVQMLRKYGSDVTVFGRDPEAAAALAAETRASSASLPAAGFGGFDIVVNATPLGTRGPLENETIASADQLAGTKLVYDLTYNPEETRLAREAAIAGCEFIGGMEMLVTQALAQFEIWTGKEPPAEAMRAAARARLNSQPPNAKINKSDE